jgi:Tol biopolymer transport system component
MRRAAALVLLVLVTVAAGIVLRARRPVPLPPGLSGTLLYVSDRGGVDTLYARVLPAGPERRLTFFSESVRDPALSFDGARVAFSVGGRIGVVSLASGDVRLLTYGVDFRDTQPAWRGDGAALVVTSRRPSETAGDIYLLEPLDPTGGQTGRKPVTQSRGLDESEPALSPDGTFVVFVREDNLVRQDLDTGRTRRLTGGFRKTRQPVFIGEGRLLCLWTQDKRYGIDTLDADGRNRQTIGEGTTFYRTVVPSPDGRFFAATFAFDLAFHPTDALRPRHVEEVHLLDARGALLAPLVREFGASNHSPQWGR